MSAAMPPMLSWTFWGAARCGSARDMSGIQSLADVRLDSELFLLRFRGGGCGKTPAPRLPTMKLVPEDRMPGGDTPNTWRPVRVGKTDEFTAIYVCPQGHAGLIDDHQIAPDGTVTPSVVCEGYPAGFCGPDDPGSPCEFHDHIQLKDWKARP